MQKKAIQNNLKVKRSIHTNLIRFCDSYECGVVGDGMGISMWGGTLVQVT